MIGVGGDCVLIIKRGGLFRFRGVCDIKMDVMGKMGKGGVRKKG